MLHILSRLPTIHLISKFNCFKVYLILSFQFHPINFNYNRFLFSNLLLLLLIHPHSNNNTLLQ